MPIHMFSQQLVTDLQKLRDIESSETSKAAEHSFSLRLTDYVFLGPGLSLRRKMGQKQGGQNCSWF